MTGAGTAFQIGDVVRVRCTIDGEPVDYEGTLAELAPAQPFDEIIGRRHWVESRIDGERRWYEAHDLTLLRRATAEETAS